MTDKQIKLDGSFIPIEEAIKAGLISEKDINVPSKQIIIDGVDVSGCPQLMEDYQRANNIEGRYEHIKHVCECGERGVEEYWFECKYNPNCYYKQLKRKEQECDMWKNLTVDNGAVALKYQEQLDLLKAENKHLNDLLNQALKELEQSREAIEKIKELIQKEINDCEHCDDCESCEYNCCTKQILQICDEVNDVK